MKSEVLNIWKQSLKQKDKSFYHFHLDKLVNNLKLWHEKFPTVTPYYAVKCNPNQQILTTLALRGSNFDCASKTEIKQVSKLQTESGSYPDIIFANPIKMKTHLQYANKTGIEYMTADCPEELPKIEKYHENAKVILRIAVDDSNSLCKFNKKFGMFPEKQNLARFFDKFDGLNKSKLVGISFHVGSGCSSSDSYRTAIESARECFDFAQNRGYKLKILDIGGGFIEKEPLISNVAYTVNNAIRDQFAKINPMVIAEPGRFLVGNIADLYVKVTGKKKESGVIKYYINNSVYGDFNCKIFDYAKFDYNIFKKNTKTVVRKNKNGAWEDEKTEMSCSSRNSTVFGATCDSIDVILENVEMPEMEIGDLLKFKEMGAYTNAAASSFNGIAKPYIYYYGKSAQNLRRYGTVNEKIS